MWEKGDVLVCAGAELAGLDGSSMPPEIIREAEKRAKEVEEQQAEGASLLG